jgi:hypothetical protein
VNLEENRPVSGNKQTCSFTFYYRVL